MTTMKTQNAPAKTTRKTSNEEAIAAFAHNVASALELMTLIRRHLDDHMGVGPDEVNWGHVGDAGHTVEQLKEIARSCNLIGEQD